MQIVGELDIHAGELMKWTSKHSMAAWHDVGNIHVAVSKWLLCLQQRKRMDSCLEIGWLRCADQVDVLIPCSWVTVFDIRQKDVLFNTNSGQEGATRNHLDCFTSRPQIETSSGLWDKHLYHSRCVTTRRDFVCFILFANLITVL